MGNTMCQGTITNTNISEVPGSKKGAIGQRDPEMHRTRKGGLYCLGIKAYVCVNGTLDSAHSRATSQQSGRT